MSPVSATEPDWTRETPRAWWDPPRRLMRTIRRYQAVRSNPVLRRWWALQHRFWSVICGAEIDLMAEIGGGLQMNHPNGIVLHPKAVIGVNCLIFQQVTLGAGPVPGFPRLGGHVDVGAGAKILGGIAVGDHARIGANAVVIKDVPSGATVVGVPAQIVGAKS